MNARSSAVMLGMILLLLLPFVSRGQRVVEDKPLTWDPCNTQNVRIPIQEAPPYSLGMPVEVIYTYMAIDSLAKLGVTPRLLASTVLDSISSDTLISLLSYIHAAVDYNPAVFRDYLNLGYYMNESYTSQPGRLYGQFESSVYDKLGWEAVEPFIAFSDVIYEIEVTGVWENHHGRTSSNITAVLEDDICVQAVVNEVIKGGPFMYVCQDEQPITECVSFAVKKGQKTKFDDLNIDIMILYDDSVGTDSSGATIYELKLAESNNIHYAVHDIQAGNRYMLFGRIYREYGTVNGLSYHELFLYRGHQRAGGLFEVTGGYVRDYDNYFGWGESVPLNTFKENIRSIITNISE
ncbi:MAG: hypothetical protein KFH87_01910 [Bacteroidetes bacterium]|nr:hypothetical protein [Bacteroidota bacterium]